MQTLRLNRVLHEVCLRDNGRDGKADRDSHAAKGLRILREILVATAHVAWIEIRVWAHGGEVQRIDAWFRQHQDADASRFPPDTIEIVPSWVARGAMSEEGLQHMPHVVDLWRDIAIHPVLKTVSLSHVHDRLGACEEERAAHVGGDVAHQLAAEARDLVVVEGREAAEEHGTEGEVDDELVDDARDEQGSSFAGAHKLHGCAGIRG